MILSIALCTYNGAEFLQAQLESIAAQTRLPDELVICDDGSTDSTVDIISGFASSVPFPVRLSVNEVNLKSTRNFEQSIHRCTGDIIFLCDQDDYWHPEKIARFESLFKQSRDTLLVASDLQIVDTDLKPLGYCMWENLPFSMALQERMEGGDCHQLFRFNVITGAAAAFRSSLRSALFPIPGCWVHDGWIGFIAAVLGQIRFLREPLTLYRQHSRQQIGMQRLTLSRQVTFARLRSAPYFGLLAECFEVLADHMETLRPQLRDPGVVAKCRDRAMHARVQERMRLGNRLQRILPAIGELRNGHYHQYGHGLKAFAADLFL